MENLIGSLMYTLFINKYNIANKEVGVSTVFQKFLSLIQTFQ